jgi:carbamoyltransferase
MYVLGYSGFTRDSRFSLGSRNPFAKTRQGFDSIFTFREGEIPFQMFPLGFFGHDAAAALIKDGKVIACAAEERFNRVKYSLNLLGNTLLPKNAIEYCLDFARISINKIDVVAHYCDFNRPVIEKRLSLLEPFLSPQEELMVRDSYQNTFNEMMDRDSVLDQFTKMTGHRPKKFLQVNHHMAHAASTFYPSGFKESIIFTIDGCGESESSLLAIGQKKQIQEIKRSYLPNSLGTLYLITTVFLGFKSLGDEYKVMGLAGYGKPEKYRTFFQSLIRLEEGGLYSMDKMARPDFKQILIDGLGRPRKPQEPIEERHCDIAAALQESLQTTVLHTLRYARKEITISNLCMAGGVALNSALNGALAGSGLFNDIFIQPASSDEGCSLGAAYHAYLKECCVNYRRLPKLKDVYLGPSYQKSEIHKVLKKYENDLSWECATNLSEIIAQEIAAGKVIGWFQGRMEFGPRALGNRSILADPRQSGMKNRINAKIKHREDFRPFAPAILEEDTANFFNLNGIKSSPYMLFVVPVKKDQRKKIPAVIHVDGTARIQTVSKKTNKKFWGLLMAFKQLTGIPVLLNTSFNVMNEPIVCSPEDAISCYLSTDLDLLVLGDFIVRKNNTNGA